MSKVYLQHNQSIKVACGWSRYTLTPV